MQNRARSPLWIRFCRIWSFSATKCVLLAVFPRSARLQMVTFSNSIPKSRSVSHNASLIVVFEVWWGRMCRQESMGQPACRNVRSACNAERSMNTAVDWIGSVTIVVPTPPCSLGLAMHRGWYLPSVNRSIVRNPTSSDGDSSSVTAEPASPA